MDERKTSIVKVKAEVTLHFPSHDYKKDSYDLATQAESALNAMGRMKTDYGEIFSPRFHFQEILSAKGHVIEKGPLKLKPETKGT